MSDMIARLELAIAARRNVDPSESYVAFLTGEGRPRIAKKFGEEAVELALASVTGNRDDVVAESADLMFHMLVLLADCGVPFAAVEAELARREGMSGLAEKASRGQTGE